MKLSILAFYVFHLILCVPLGANDSDPLQKWVDAIVDGSVKELHFVPRPFGDWDVSDPFKGEPEVSYHAKWISVFRGETLKKFGRLIGRPSANEVYDVSLDHFVLPSSGGGELPSLTFTLSDDILFIQVREAERKQQYQFKGAAAKWFRSKLVRIENVE